jgi:hypothetical protein
MGKNPFAVNKYYITLHYIKHVSCLISHSSGYTGFKWSNIYDLRGLSISYLRSHHHQSLGAHVFQFKHGHHSQKGASVLLNNFNIW